MPLTLRDLDLPAMTAALAGYGIEAAKAARVFAAVQRMAWPASTEWIGFR